ncbi:MAG: hypothetical protein JW818_15820 [Pirellulales bacterium]|nr:hypothetical protein [Pirellulales bacterium]
MSSDNPFKTPKEDSSSSTPSRRPSNVLGTGILLVGLSVVAYGAVAFWLIQSLPPNGGGNGRLPSLYVMGVGIVVAVVGLIARDFRVGRKAKGSTSEARKGIPTVYGIIGLLAILIIFFLVVYQL